MHKLHSVAIEASNLIDNKPTGVPNYSRRLISGLLSNPEFTERNELFLLLSSSRWKKRNQTPFNGCITKNYYIKNFLLNNNYALIHYTGVYHNHNRRIPKIVTIHDIAVLKPEHNLPCYTTRETIAKTRENMACIAKNVNSIIFVSESTRQDFLNLFTFPEGKTSVVYLGSEFIAKELLTTETPVLARFRIRPKQYFLFVGGVSVRKNVLSLVKAFLLEKHRSDFDLVLAGNIGLGSDLIFEEIRKHDKKNRIKFTGFVSDEELTDLYKNAGAFVFPTYYEGFGMPIIDAMNFGIPVMIGNKGAAPEVSGKLATLVDPFSIDSISDGLEKVLNVDCETLLKAKEHAQNFTWKKCAEKTNDIYKGILG